MVGLALCAGGLPFPFVASRGPVHCAMSYELFSRMAGAAPLAARSALEGFAPPESLPLRCCLAPGDSGRLLEFPGLPVTTGTAVTGGLSFARNPIWHWSTYVTVAQRTVHKELTPVDV